MLNASGRAARAATRDRYTGAAIDFRGFGAALTAPGAVDGWIRAHQRFGRLPLKTCLQPAIAYARHGFPVSGSLARFSADCVELLRAVATTAATYLKKDGSPYRRGETMRNPRLADTLEAIAAYGREGFYGGRVARDIGGYLARHGGVLKTQDLEEHRSEWVTPATVRYRGRTAVAPPANSQGFAGLQILGILDHFDVAAVSDDPVAYIDAMVRATAVAFQDRDRYLTDPEHAEVAVQDLLDESYLASRAEVLNAALPAVPVARPAATGDTTFSCAVDSYGNAAAVTQSIYAEWGSGVVAGDTGVLMQNRGSFFSLDPQHDNRLERGKRTAHTLTAGMLLGAGGLELVYGTMGGEGQPQTSAIVATRVIDHELSVQAAIDEPRWLLGRTWGEEHRGLRLEGRFGQQAADTLSARGHENVTLVDDYSQIMGHAQAIQVFRDRLEAAADPRSDGAALGF